MKGSKSVGKVIIIVIINQFSRQFYWKRKYESFFFGENVWLTSGVSIWDRLAVMFSTVLRHAWWEYYIKAILTETPGALAYFKNFECKFYNRSSWKQTRKKFEASFVCERLEKKIAMKIHLFLNFYVQYSYNSIYMTVIA